jgi:hypothetical protein
MSLPATAGKTTILQFGWLKDVYLSQTQSEDDCCEACYIRWPWKSCIDEYPTGLVNES